jgi:hypothetical protein
LLDRLEVIEERMLRNFFCLIENPERNTAVGRGTLYRAADRAIAGCEYTPERSWECHDPDFGDDRPEAAARALEDLVELAIDTRSFLKAELDQYELYRIIEPIDYALIYTSEEEQLKVLLVQWRYRLARVIAQIYLHFVPGLHWFGYPKHTPEPL